jgi:hypothetical protein
MGDEEVNQDLDPDDGRNFSIANAKRAADEMFAALPKGKRLEYLGHLNEVLVTLQSLYGFFVNDITEDEDAVRKMGRLPVTEVMQGYLDRQAERLGIEGG